MNHVFDPGRLSVDEHLDRLASKQRAREGVHLLLNDDDGGDNDDGNYDSDDDEMTMIMIMISIKDPC